MIYSYYIAWNNNNILHDKHRQNHTPMSLNKEKSTVLKIAFFY